MPSFANSLYPHATFYCATFSLLGSCRGFLCFLLLLGILRFVIVLWFLTLELESTPNSSAFQLICLSQCICHPINSRLYMETCEYLEKSSARMNEWVSPTLTLMVQYTKRVGAASKDVDDGRLAESYKCSRSSLRNKGRSRGRQQEQYGRYDAHGDGCGCVLCLMRVA